KERWIAMKTLESLKSLPTIVALLAIAACGGTSSEPERPAEATATPAAPAGPSSDEPASTTTFASQVARGGELFGEHCASCHGEAGQGGSKAPPLVGAQALPLNPAAGAKRNVQFRTALDVFLWAK